MLKLNRFELAAVRRTAQNVKTRVNRAEKLRKLIEDNQKLLDQLDNEIKMWENPIVTMTGGYTSIEVLSLINENNELPEKETPAEEVPQTQEPADSLPEVDTTPIEGNDNFMNY